MKKHVLASSLALKNFRSDLKLLQFSIFYWNNPPIFTNFHQEWQPELNNASLVNIWQLGWILLQFYFSLQSAIDPVNWFIFDQVTHKNIERRTKLIV